MISLRYEQSPADDPENNDGDACDENLFHDEDFLFDVFQYSSFSEETPDSSQLSLDCAGSMMYKEMFKISGTFTTTERNLV